ncbi:MAG: hypothetical protein QXI70_07795 [Methanothrix sp.]
MRHWKIVMGIPRLLLLICMICLVQMACGETIDLGPVSVYMDLEDLKVQSVEKEDAISMDHSKGGVEFQYTIYPATITMEDGHRIWIEVHQMNAPVPLDAPISEREDATGIEHCIMESSMMPRRVSFEKEVRTIDGQDGWLFTINNGALYIAGWSPDQLDGSGSIICIVGSDMPWESTEGIFGSLRTDF